jgi:hypothetical protein
MIVYVESNFVLELAFLREECAPAEEAGFKKIVEGLK